MRAQHPDPVTSATGRTTVALDSPNDLLGWWDRWNTLAVQSGALIFRSPAWVAAWWEVLHPDDRVELLVRGDDQPDGLVALATGRRRLHPRLPIAPTVTVLAGSGVGAADHLGPVGVDAFTRRQLVADAVSHVGGRPLQLAELSDEFGATARALGATPIHQRRCPAVALSPEAGPATWPRHLRKALRRRERRAAELGIERRWIRLDAGSSEPIGQLNRLHDAVWASRGRSGLSTSWRDELVLRVAEASTGDDGAWMQVLERDGMAVAALLGFRYGSTFCSYRTGWDPSLRSLGLGLLLHSDAIRRASSLGCGRYDFLRGTEPHKYTLGGVDAIESTSVVGRGVAGRLIVERERRSAQRNAGAGWHERDSPAASVSC